MKRLLAGLLFLLAFGVSAEERPFRPADDGGLVITVTNSSVAQVLPLAGSSWQQIELQNAGSATVFVKICPTSTCTATTAAGYAILVGQSKIISSDGTVKKFIATISGTTGQTLYVHVGEGN